MMNVGPQWVLCLFPWGSLLSPMQSQHSNYRVDTVNNDECRTRMVLSLLPWGYLLSPMQSQHSNYRVDMG